MKRLLSKSEKEKARQRTKRWRANNPEKYRELNRKMAARLRRNPEKYRELNRKMAARRLRLNPDKVRAYARRWWAKQDAIKSNQSIARRLRNRMYSAMKGCKRLHLHELLVCSLKELREHLEAQFKPGMSWNNYGPNWHIDHIVPCASFDLSSPDQQRRCFHYTNLQPLWAAENISKNDRI